MKKAGTTDEVNAPNENQRILRSRAATLAREPESALTSQEALDVIEFALASERYALEALHVREVHRLDDLTPLPGTPAFVVGIVNIRGRILPVFDIRKFFGLPEVGITDAHRILIVFNDEMELGILADVVIGVRAIPTESIQPSLPTLVGIRGDYLKGVTAERLIILDTLRMLSDPRMIVHDEVEP